MKINAITYQNVEINPLEVITNLIKSELSDYRDICEREGEYYLIWEEGAGCHSYTQTERIDKSLYEYINSLKTVKKYLEHNGK